MVLLGTRKRGKRWHHDIIIAGFWDHTMGEESGGARMKERKSELDMKISAPATRHANF